MPIGYYITSGYSTVNIPLCANMQNTSLSADGVLSGSALTEWNTDMAVGKIGIRIPIEAAYPFDGQVIEIHYDENVPPTTNTSDAIGYFTTKTSATILTSGEWQPLVYMSGMLQKQYEYFMEPSRIYAYTSTAFKSYSGDTIVVSGGVDFGALDEWPLSSEVYDKLGKFDLRVFYDQVEYGLNTSEYVNLDSAVNNTTGTAVSVALLPGKNYVQVEYISGSYETYGNTSYVFNVSGNSMVYYGDRSNKIELTTEESVIGLFASSNNSSVGNIVLQYKLTNI